MFTKKPEVYEVSFADPTDVLAMHIIARDMINELPQKRQHPRAVWQLCQIRHYRTKLIKEFRRTFHKADKHYLKRIIRFLASHLAMLSLFVAPSALSDEFWQAYGLLQFSRLKESPEALQRASGFCHFLNQKLLI